MKNFFKYLKKSKAPAVLAPLFKLIEALLELTVPLIVAEIINAIDSGSKGVSYVVYACLILVGIGLVGFICAVAAQYFAAKAATNYSKEIRHDLFDKVQKLSYSQIDSLGTGKIITRITSDVNQLQSGVNLVLRLFLRSPFIVVGAMIMAIVLNRVVGGIFAITIAVLSIIVFIIMLVTIPLYKNVQQNLDDVTIKTRENLTGARVIRAFCKENDEITEYEKKTTALKKSQLYVGKISALLNPLTFAVINVGIIVLLYVGAINFNAGLMSRGVVVALYNYMSQILIELIKFANLIITMTKSISSYKRVNEILTMPQEKGIEPSLEVSQNTKSEHFIEFEGVNVNYNGSKINALKDISFSVKQGETVGIIGGTGSGKSTLINVLAKFYDITSGDIKINGQSIKEISKQSLIKMCGIVPQKVALFSGTIRDNIKWGDKDASDEDIMSAISTAQADNVVNSKKNGLDELVEEGGRNFSGGQKQRLTIARALVKKPEILILDDSTSALDYITDANFRKSLKTLDYKPTTFIVAQRASSIKDADKIIVLDDGEMVGFGTHKELIKSCDVYKEIYNTQFEEGRKNG